MSSPLSSVAGRPLSSVAASRCLRQAGRPLIQVEGVSWHAGPTPIVEDLTFQIDAGRSLTIVGPNGAGKSTILRLMAGLLVPTRGRILIQDDELSRMTARERARLIGFVAQGNIRLPACEVLELVTLARFAAHDGWMPIPKPQDRERAHQALTLVGAESFVGRDVNTLSGGERQKVMVATALAQDPKILLLDEPTAFLDYQQTSELMRILGEVRAAGTTVVAIHHDFNAGAMDSELLLALKKGRMAFFGAPEEFLANDGPRTLFGIPFQNLTNPVTGKALVIPHGP